MNVLILDDSPFRHQVFRDIYYGADCIANVYKYSEAVDLLSKGGWDIVQLDHDLGDYLPDGLTADTYEDGWGNKQFYTGRHVAEKLVALPKELWPKQIIVHSVNGVGGRAIMETIQRTDIPVRWEPFDPDPYLSERLAQMAERHR